MALINNGDNLTFMEACPREDGSVDVFLASDDGTIIELIAETGGGYFELSEEDE